MASHHPRDTAQNSPGKSFRENHPKRHNLPIPAWISMIAGSLSGAVTALFTAPLDIARTRQQVTKSNKSLFIVLEEMVAHDGLRGLWIGTGPTLLGLIPTWAVYWLAYHSLKNYQTQKLGLDGDSAWLHLRSAMGAGMINAVTTNPIWVIKTRLQTQTMKGKERRYMSIAHSFSVIYQEEGIKGFYKGLLPSLVGVSHVCVQFPTYEYLKLQVAERQGIDSSELSPAAIVGCSSLAKVIASVAAYPHEVLRARQQKDRKGHHVVVTKLMRDIYQTEGVRGFYRGLTTNLLRVVPAGAITFLSFESISKWLMQRANTGGSVR